MPQRPDQRPIPARTTAGPLPRPRWALLAPWILLATAACSGDPPRSLAGFALGMSRDQVMEQVRARGGFTCTVRGTRPPENVCEGRAEQGFVRVVVRSDSAVAVVVRMDPAARNPQRAMRRVAREFGSPAWRERPYPGVAAPLEGYHTLWLDRDTTRALAAVCSGPELTPPCTVELTATSPVRVLAVLDSLLDARQDSGPARRSR